MRKVNVSATIAFQVGLAVLGVLATHTVVTFLKQGVNQRFVLLLVGCLLLGVLLFRIAKRYMVPKPEAPPDFPN